jgi:hypothetical protein
MWATVLCRVMANLTTKQVAERRNVGEAAVRQWCRRGLLIGAYEMETPRGPVWMIPEAALVSFTPPKKTGRPRKLKEELKEKAA